MTTLLEPTLTNTKTTPHHHYNEEVAQKLLLDNKIDELIVYMIPTIHAYLKHHKWSFLTIDNYYDISQDLCISLIGSIRTYKKEAGTKILTWVYGNYRFCMLVKGKKEIPYSTKQMQLDLEFPWLAPGIKDFNLDIPYFNA